MVAANGTQRQQQENQMFTVVATETNLQQVLTIDDFSISVLTIKVEATWLGTWSMWKLELDIANTLLNLNIYRKFFSKEAFSYKDSTIISEGYLHPKIQVCDQQKKKWPYFHSMET